MFFRFIGSIPVHIYVIATIFVFFGCYFGHQRSEQKKAVAQASTRYKALLAVIARVTKDVTDVRKVQEIHEVRNSLQSFRNFNSAKFMDKFVAENKSHITKLLQVSERNQVAYQEIQNVFLGTPRSEKDWHDCCMIRKLEWSTYCKFEDELCTEVMPKIVFDLMWHVRVTYTSPAGRNRYVNEFDVSESGIQCILDRVSCVGTEAQLQADPYAEFKRRQRSAMTNTLRYKILQRDGFRCVLCGRSVQDGVKQLEVDHVLPVSKGGLTVESNLRTLCYDCNRGKSDHYVAGAAN